MPDTMAVKQGKDFIRMKNRVVFFLLIIICSNWSCEKNTNGSSNADFFSPVYVELNIDMAFAQYAPLNQLQGFVYLTGGNRGIVVYHTIDDQFVAYDRTCPVNANQACAMVTVDSIPTRYRCGKPDSTGWKPCCHSLFDATYGTPISGEAKVGLKPYYTSKQGSVIYIRSNPL